jgi:hypothetical protein
MLFLEDKLKIQELCANSLSTMLKCDCIFFGGSGREGIQFEETMPFRHGKLKSTKDTLWQNVVAVAKHARATISVTHSFFLS